MKHADYDPLRSPFEMPIELYQVHCQLLEPPLTLPYREHANLSTTLRGTLGDVLGTMASQSDPVMADRLKWLHRPDQLPSPISIRSLEPASPRNERGRLVTNAFKFRLGLVGQRAIDERELAFDALQMAGSAGFNEPDLGDEVEGNAQGRSVRFAPTRQKRFEGTLGAWIDEQRAQQPVQEPLNWVRLDFVTQLQPSGRADEFDRSTKAPLIPLSEWCSAVLGGVAKQLVKWHRADQGLPDKLEDDPQERTDIAEKKARERPETGSSPAKPRTFSDIAEKKARASLAQTTIRGELVHRRHQERRWSGSNMGKVRLDGFTGWLTIEGHISEELLRWLFVMKLRGGGRKTSYGLGEVQLSFGNGGSPKPLNADFTF